MTKREENIIRRFLARIGCEPNDWDKPATGPDLADVRAAILRAATALAKEER